LPKEVANLILPFVVPSKDCRIPFTEEMETSTIFCMAESDRKKGEGILLKKPQEEILFIVESFYPIWIISWKGRTLLFDGLGVTQGKLTYDVLPDIKKFITDVEESAEKLETYSAALSDNVNYFKSFSRSEEKTLPGLIGSSDFIEDFSSYLSMTEKVEQSKIETTFLTPVVDESSIAISLKELTELRTALENDWKNLRQSMKMLKTTTRKHVNAINKSIRENQTDFNKKIEAKKSSALIKVRKIQRTYDERITKASKKFERQLQRLHKERTKLEKAAQRAESQIDRCRTEIELARQSKNQPIQQRWKQEMENWKLEIKGLQKNIEEIDKRIEKTESEKQIEISNLRSEFDSQAESAMKNVRELEASRDANLQLNRQKIESLEELTSSIITQLDDLNKKKRTSRNELNKIGMSNKKKATLVYVPFYLAYFQADSERRYIVYSPSIAGALGILAKLKGVLGISKIKSLFQQRSKAIAKILNQVVDVLESDPVFKRDFHDAATKANILQNKKTREMMKTGLEELKREEWISENEFQTLSQSLTTNQE